MYNLDDIKLNEQIKKYRESRNISVTQLGKLISKSKSTISKYESGTIIPDTITLIEICNVLNIDLNELFPQCKNSIRTEQNNLFTISKLYFYYYTQNHLVTSIAELINIKNSNITKIRFYNGVKNTNKYADKFSYYYEGELTYDKTVGYINLANINSQGTQYEKIQITFIIPWNEKMNQTFFFICALTPHSIPVVKKGIMSVNEISNIHEYDNYLKISKDDLNKIKYNNAWILNDSNYDDLFFNQESEF
jgi:transcriptional regulator with XRE-family HTH domain